MNDERFEQLMRDAAASFRRPPEPPIEEMWDTIEREAFGRNRAKRRLATWADRVVRSQSMRVAAALVIGVGLGRVWTSARPATDTASLVGGMTAAAPIDSTLQPYEVATTRYLGQTAALLIALPSELRSGQANRNFTTRASDLLLTTRLLLDSPASTDPDMRNLLEDLELVLAQIVRLHDARGRTEMELINQALEQRDVLPRLRSAVADIAADD